MIRIDLTQPPTRWHAVTVLDDQGEPAEIRVQYALLDLEAVTAYRRDQMQLGVQGAASRDDGAAQADFLRSLLDRMSPEQLAERRAVLRTHILGWDLVDPDQVPLPCTPEIIAAVVGRADFFAPLFEGLLEASEGAPKRGAGNGSAGGRTTSKR